MSQTFTFAEMKWQYKEEKPYGKLCSLCCYCCCHVFSLFLVQTAYPNVEVRVSESAKIRDKHPDRVPVSSAMTVALL